ncbi:hypothetical protein DLAC_11038 [Tieghemostelium lacteum]|uniref:Peptidoglycan binding-like domain-containing protein n=1 Tax=Tieghemostelium lacteum TaxID=361077 RepID=A0A151Z310_TIELA|nr:hypothetical protein DLAC_11038 [Tieghemostelium lacteum]|eukprot:KYQ88339.1 hypothetical protein DLAC_11038 [Tieghemostelium lacteum]
MSNRNELSREDKQLLENLGKKEPYKKHQHQFSEYSHDDAQSQRQHFGIHSNRSPITIDNDDIEDPIEKELRKKMYSMLSNSIQSNNNNNSNSYGMTTTTHSSSYGNLTDSLSNNNNNNSSSYSYSNQNNDTQLRDIKKAINNQQIDQSSYNNNNNNNLFGTPRKSQKSNASNQPLAISNSALNSTFTTPIKQQNSLQTSTQGTNLLNQQVPQEDELDLEKNYVVVERNRVKQFAKEYGFHVEREYEILKEYKLYVVEDWVYKSNHTWTAVVFSGNSSDKIVASIIRPDQQNKNLHSLIAKPPNSTFYGINSAYGQLLLANHSVKTSQQFIKLVEVPDGDFDSHIDRIKLNLSLKRLGCTQPSYQLSINPVPRSTETEFEKISNRPYNSSSISEFIKEIQAALSNLNYLPQLTKIDGCYDQKTINAVKAFQIDLNKQRLKTDPSIPTIKAEGYLNETTFKGIVNEIYLLKKKIDSFLPSKKLNSRINDPIKQYNLFSQYIKEFQDTYGIYPDAPGKNIHLYLERLKANLDGEHEKSNDIFYNDQFDDDDDDDEDGHSHSHFHDDDEEDEDEYYESDNFNSESEMSQDFSPMTTSPSIPIRGHSNLSSVSGQQNFSSPSSPLSGNTPNALYSSPSSASPSIKPKPNIPGVSSQQQSDGQQQGLHKHSLSHDNSMLNDLETYEDAKEKELLKETILKLETLLETQQHEYDKLKEEFDRLADNYYDIKEQSLRSIAIIQTNEKIFNEMNSKYQKLVKQELPEIEDKILSNIDVIQSYSNRMKRLDEIVGSIQRKHDRNIFSITTSYLWSIVSLVAVFFAYLIMFFGGVKSKINTSSASSSSSSSQYNKSLNSSTSSTPSSSTPPLENRDQDIKQFISKQRLKLSSLMLEDIDDMDSTQQPSPKF